ncbi:MAG: helix-turn-helix domain-containing protein, partial [Clostridia bacterium]|nr:helix-turn-helix domain-containing protein [Clostridia bacterium]
TFEAQRAYREANREKIAEAQRAYREANREKIAEAQRAYYEANREKIAEAQRAYREANREKIAEIGAALRRWRLARNLNQTELGELIGLKQRIISYWERGEVPIDFDRIRAKCPRVMEAFE